MDDGSRIESHSGPENPLPLEDPSLSSRIAELASRFHFAAAAVFLLALTGLVTYPGFWHLDDRLWGMGDLWQHLWNFWWYEKALTELHTSPYFTEYMYYPTGASLASQSFSEFNLLLGIPLRWALGPVVAYNLLVIFSYVVSGLGAYLLVHYLTGSRSGGLLAAVAFAFSPYRVGHLMFFHMQSTEWLPFFVWSLLRLWEAPGLRKGLLSGVFLALASLCTWYYLVFLVLLTLLFLGFQLVTDRSGLFRPAFLNYLAIGGVTAAVLIAPFLLPLLREAASGASYLRMDFDIAYSADLLSFFLPSEHHPVFGAGLARTYARFNTDFRERVNYLGLVALALGVYALYRRPSRLRGSQLFWWLSIAGFSLLALGPRLQVNGRIFQGMVLPYAALKILPGFQFMRAPLRLVSIASLAVSVVAGFGAASVAERTASWYHTQLAGRGWAFAVTLFLVGALLFDVWMWRRFPLTPVGSLPEVYRELAEDDGAFTILEVPLPQLQYPLPLYYQTIHQKKLMGGYVSRPPEKAERFLQENPFLSMLVEPDRKYSGVLTPNEAANAHQLISSLDVGWVIVRKGWLSSDLIADWMTGIYGEPTYQDESLRAFRVVPGVPRARFLSNDFVKESTEAPSLYASELHGLTGYKVKLEPGTYTVTLKFAEIYFDRAEERVFDIRVEGMEVARLDIVKRVGRFTPLDISVGTVVEDGVLDVDFTPVRNLPKLSGLVVSRNEKAVFEMSAASAAEHAWDGNFGYLGNAGFYRTRVPVKDGRADEKSPASGE